MTEPGTDLQPAYVGTFELDQRRAKAYAESGYWKDTSSVARALVKIEAGRALGLPAHTAMTEINVINEKWDIGSGALAALVKANPRYDYWVMELTEQTCSIRFLQNGKEIGISTFTMADATRAGLDKRNPTYKTYPRNMLFARAMSNGVAWYCPDVTMGRVYVDRELEESLELSAETPEPLDLRVVDEQLQEAELADFEPIPASPIDQEDEPENPFVAPPPKSGN